MFKTKDCEENQMKKSCLFGTLSAAIIIFLSTATSAALIDNGGGLIYDDVLEITWSQPSTQRTWDEANTLASGLMLGGVSGWRLPYVSVLSEAGPLPSSTPPIDCRNDGGPDCEDNELGYMYVKNLGSNPVSSLFPSLQPDGSYWSGTAESLDNAWFLSFSTGESLFGSKTSIGYSWAVHAGNVSPVPIPAAVWLFGSGLIGLISMARRKKA